jgi:hypothetical protein
MKTEKIFLDKELWYIKNFLTKEEIRELMVHANEKTGWYKTSRCYSIRNKFIGVDVKLHPKGTVCPTRGIDLSGDAIFPDPKKNAAIEEHLYIFERPQGIFDRLEKVLPPTLVKQNTLQSFWPLENDDPKNIGGAYNWHFEKGNEGQKDSGMTATWSIYLNDNFEGGILKFLEKPYSIKPEPGMLVSVPLTKEWQHRVTPVTKGIRHTLYGTCFKNIFDRKVSTGDSC